MSKTRSNADMANKLAFDSIAAMEAFIPVENNNVAIVKNVGTYIHDSTEWKFQKTIITSPDGSLWSIEIDDLGVITSLKI